MVKSIKHIGWIGTGVMGNPMAKHQINNGFKLSVFNRTKSKTDELVQLGANFSHPNDMASEVDALVLMVGYPNDLRKIVFEERLLDAVKPGTQIIDHTTSNPGLAIEIAEKAKLKEIESIDAPVSGGEINAISGKLSIMAGGFQTGFDRSMEIFNCYGKTTSLFGGPGTGQHTKMANQIAIAGTVIGICETLMYGQKAGLDLNLMFETIKGGGAGSFLFNSYIPKILKDDMNPGFNVKLLVKDLEIALDEFRRLGICLPGLSLVHQLYRGLMAQGSSKDGAQALIKVLEKINAMKIDKYEM